MPAEHTKNFEFSLKEREEKIWKILGKSNDTVVTTEDVRRRWAAHLEKILPACPWIGLIKPSKVVDVISIDWFNFKAVVEPIQEGKTEPEECSLVQLWPFNDDQSEDLSRIMDGAEALDHFRFFISNLWFPWDEDDDGEDSEDGIDNWLTDHLTLRVKMK